LNLFSANLNPENRYRELKYARADSQWNELFEVPIEKNGRLLISIHVAEKEMDF
jgi:hypothetical protein